MHYILIIRDEAVEEVKDAYLYYERVREGLGERFLSELRKRYLEISEHPQYYSFIDNKKSIRDIKVRHFPFKVIYEIIENRVIIFSVFNRHQDPSKRNLK